MSETIKLTASDGHPTRRLRCPSQRQPHRRPGRHPGNLRSQPAHPFGRRQLRERWLPGRRTRPLRSRRAQRRAPLRRPRSAKRHGHPAKARYRQVRRRHRCCACLRTSAHRQESRRHRLLLRRPARLAQRHAPQSRCRRRLLRRRHRQLRHRNAYAPVQLHFGKLDTHIPAEQVNKVQAAHPQVEIHWYENAGHGFNCDMRASYNAEAAALARTRALAFLKKHLA